jgi:hypothetical protein
MIVLIIITAIVCVLFTGRAWRATRDIYHPAMVIAPALVFLYVIQPSLLVASPTNDAYFTRPQLLQIQIVDLFGVVALLIGATRTPGVFRRRPGGAVPPRELRKVAMAVGSLGLGVWFYTLKQAGGFLSAFSQSYGGGWNDSGYIRDLALFLPFIAVLLMLYIVGRTSARASNVVLAAMFGMPLLVQGILGARRGPTFMLFAACMCAFDMGRGRRPHLTKGLLGGIFIVTLLMVLFSNRGNIYIGSDQTLDLGNISTFAEVNPGMEYVVGGAVSIDALETGRFAWGTNWLAELVVRPVPHEWWPTKWIDWASWTGQAVIGGNFAPSSSGSLDWAPPPGSAAGIVGETFAEWGWFYLPMLWVIGKLYAAAWAKARCSQGNWPIYYVVFLAVSIYLTLQGPTDTIYRLVLITGILYLVLRLGGSASSRSRVRSGFTSPRYLRPVSPARAMAPAR